MLLQASKRDAAQPDIVDVLPRFNPAGRVADVCVVGCGPSGLALASELASQGLSVALLGEWELALTKHLSKTLSKLQWSLGGWRVP